MFEICPKCGGTALLVQVRDEFEDLPEPARPEEANRLHVKVEEYRCQEQSCEFEFEKTIREPPPQGELP
jgi:hypothetical protein